MIEVSTRNEVVHLEVLGWTKLWALTSSLDVPALCIKNARAGAPGVPSFQAGDRRVGGTSVRGLYAAGSFTMGSPRRRAFLDLRRASKEVLVLELENHEYDLVMVEVANVASALQVVGEAARI